MKKRAQPPLAKASRGEASQEVIFETALSLFRKRGFDRTTMRDVASKAGVALGGTYYYFRSKNDIVSAYYERLRGQHELQVRRVLETEPDLRKRLGAMFGVSMDLLKRDRKLIAGLFRSIGDVEAVSPFSAETAALRERAVKLFEDALGPADLPEETRRLVATALWGGHMAMLLYMMLDESKGQQKTRRLVDGMLDALVPMIPALPMLGPTVSGMASVLKEAGLIPP
jgi:AcrR family transcriptional regulator